MTPAEAFEHHLVPHLFGPWAEQIVAQAGDLTGLRILDIATATGTVARLAACEAGPTGQVSGLDIDPTMLAVAAAQPAPPATAPIRWVEASALAMPFPDASFDRVFCVEGTQFFPDRLAGFREIHRVLAPGGSLITSNWGPLSGNPGYHALSDALRSFVSDVAAILPPVGLSDPAEIAALAHEAGFTAIAVRADHLDLRLPSARDFVAWIAAGGPTIRHNMAQLSDDRRGDFLRFVEGRLARYAAPDGTLRLPSMRHILTAAR